MDFIKFLHRAFCVVAEYMAVAAWHGCDAIDVVYHAGKDRTKDVSYHCLQCFYDSGKYVERENNLFLVREINQ